VGLAPTILPFSSKDPNTKINTSLSYPLPSPVRSNGYHVTRPPTILADLHRRSIPRDPTAIMSSSCQLAQVISTVDVTCPIEQLSHNLAHILARPISSRERVRKVVFSCYLSPTKVNRVKLRNTIYHFISVRDTSYHLQILHLYSANTWLNLISSFLNFILRGLILAVYLPHSRSLISLIQRLCFASLIPLSSVFKDFDPEVKLNPFWINNTW